MGIIRYDLAGLVEKLLQVIGPNAVRLVAERRDARMYFLSPLVLGLYLWERL